MKKMLWTYYCRNEKLNIRVQFAEKISKAFRVIFSNRFTIDIKNRVIEPLYVRKMALYSKPSFVLRTCFI